MSTSPPPWTTLATACAVSAAAGVAIGYALRPGSSSPSSSFPSKESEPERVVREFLHAQSERDLDRMCSLVDEDVLYVNEPHPPERAIRGRARFREAFAESPCIWCKEANLQVLQSSYQGGDTVFVERLDQFFIDGVWLAIPICGYLKVKNGKIVLWKDYWDYAKYKAFTTKHYGPDFRLFRKTVVPGS